MKNWTWSNWLMVVAVGLIFIVATVGVVYAIIGHLRSLETGEPFSHNESGFLEGVPTWERADIPLGVCAYTYTTNPLPYLDEDHRDTVRHVISKVNRRLGFGALVWATTDCNISIDIGVPYDSSWEDPGGDAEIRHTGGRAERCAVRTSNTGTSELLALTLEHEIGHCFGLAHDNYEQSIMRPTQSPTPSGSIPPWISDFDRAALRRMYGPQ